MKRIKRRNFADVSVSPASVTIAPYTADVSMKLASIPSDVLADNFPAKPGENLEKNKVLIKVSSDPNTFANAVLVGLAASGLAVGTAGLANAAMVQNRLNKVVKALQSKLGPLSVIWRQFKKFSLFAGSSILGYFSALGLIGGAVQAYLTEIFGPGLAQYGAEGMRMLAEMRANTAALAGFGLASGAGSLGAAYAVGAPKAGEKAALKTIDKAKKMFPTLKEQGLALVNTAGDKLSSLVKMKHFSNVTKVYFSNDEVVDAEIIEDVQELQANKQLGQLISIQKDGDSLLTTLALAGLAAVGALFGAGGVMTSIDAEKRLAAVVKELERSNKFWFKLKSAILYPFKGPILDEAITQFKNRALIDVGSGAQRASALDTVGHRALEILA